MNHQLWIEKNLGIPDWAFKPVFIPVIWSTYLKTLFMLPFMSSIKPSPYIFWQYYDLSSIPIYVVSFFWRISLHYNSFSLHCKSLAFSYKKIINSSIGANFFKSLLYTNIFSYEFAKRGVQEVVSCFCCYKTRAIGNIWVINLFRFSATFAKRPDNKQDFLVYLCVGRRKYGIIWECYIFQKSIIVRKFWPSLFLKILEEKFEWI